MLLLLPVVTRAGCSSGCLGGGSFGRSRGFALLRSFRVLRGPLELLSAALLRILPDASHHFFPVVGSGVFSASSEADDPDNLHGRRFNRSHRLWGPVRQVMLPAFKAVS